MALERNDSMESAYQEMFQSSQDDDVEELQDRTPVSTPTTPTTAHPPTPKTPTTTNSPPTTVKPIIQSTPKTPTTTRPATVELESSTTESSQGIVTTESSQETTTTEESSQESVTTESLQESVTVGEYSAVATPSTIPGKTMDHIEFTIQVIRETSVNFALRRTKPTLYRHDCKCMSFIHVFSTSNDGRLITCSGIKWGLVDNSVVTVLLVACLGYTKVSENK